MINKNELTKILSDKNLTSEIINYSQAKLADLFGDDFAREKDYNQHNPHHCFDLLEHTLNMILNIQSLGLTANDMRILCAAALFHDIGKPLVKKGKSNRWVYYNHESASAAIARNLFEKIGYTKGETDVLCYYIEYHGIFMPFKLPSEIDKNPYARAINRKNVEDVYNKLSDAYPSEFSSHAFSLLCDFVKSDCMAQSESVVIDGKLFDTRRAKIKRIEEIRKIALDF